jgi:putative transposase
MTSRKNPRARERLAQLRFSVVGALLASPPPKGKLRAELKKLAAKQWRHPITGELVGFGYSTVERWFYKCVKERHDPVGALRRKLPGIAGQQKSISDAVRQALLSQYAAYQSWSVRLQYDNLVALAEKQPELQPVPSYSTIRRFFRAHGLEKRKRLTSKQTEGAKRAEARLAEREVRSYEAEYVGGLWHCDGHPGSRKVLTRRGELAIPVLIGVLDDRSRLSCHLQWYLTENAENVAHCLSQAFQKRDLPASLMTDGGSGMIAQEIIEGLSRLGVVHKKTLAYSPYMNGKAESMWGQVEGRLMAMLKNVPDLTLDFLNEATQAWVEFEYNRKKHDETSQAPIERFLAGPSVSRRCPDSAALRLAFTRTDSRTQRRSDGTIVIQGRRFEIPNRYRHFRQVEIRYADWDLSHVHLVDERTGQPLCRVFPQDKAANANALRRSLEPVTEERCMPPAQGMPPLLAQLLDQQAATGLPPAYLTKNDDDSEEPIGDNR